MRADQTALREAARPTGPASPRGAVDLHVHTTHSDGSCSPCEVVRAASVVKLSALAITDHDTVSALAVARPEAAGLGIELISGVELTCVLASREVHLLGHFIREDNPPLLKAMRQLRLGRMERMRTMAQTLHSQGLILDLDVLETWFPRAALGRRHAALYLARTGQVSSEREAFRRFLGDGCPAIAPKPRLNLIEAIRLVRGAGGVPGLAHPPFNLRAATLEALAGAGLGAIEVNGPGISGRLGRRFRDWASQLDLVPIAGSDFHAPDRPGRWVGAITTTPLDLERLRSRRGSTSRPFQPP
ncbi:MAG: PHP domain-containing protein [Planctomycetaceae bacterium]|nr:PHP domain-containing protein [Planctomycetaceae bacterium]